MIFQETVHPDFSWALFSALAFIVAVVSMVLALSSFFIAHWRLVREPHLTQLSMY